MGSYHSRQIADLVLLLSELSFFNNTNKTNSIFIFCRYIDDGSMLTNKTNLSHIITNLCDTYPLPSPQTITLFTISTSHYHSTTITCCITKYITKFIKSLITNICTHIFHQIIPNTFSLASSRPKLYTTANSQLQSTTTILPCYCAVRSHKIASARANSVQAYAIFGRSTVFALRRKTEYGRPTTFRPF